MSLIFTVGTGPNDGIRMADLADLPHLLVAGTTGSGKSVFLNSLLVDLIRGNGPENLRLLLIDPKRVELAAYNGAPHVLTGKAIWSENTAFDALQWCVKQMDMRYAVLESTGTKTVDDFNVAMAQWPYLRIPRIVIAIDELANLILRDSRFEDPLVAIASMGRAAGLHLVAATQRPSADVLTGLLRANIPARAAFATVTAMDSRIILDQTGAEKLRGKGDMLFRQGTSLLHLQGRMLRDEEIEEAIAA